MIEDDLVASKAEKAAQKKEMEPVNDAMVACLSNLVAEINALLPPIIEQAEEANAKKDAEDKVAKKES